MSEYPILGFAPDLPADMPGVLVSSSQVLPTSRGIANGISVLGGASRGTHGPRGGAALESLDGGTIRYLIGSRDKLFDKLGGDLSGTAYSAAGTNTWSFAQFGTIVLAANLGDVLQASSSATTNFAAVSGAPKASIVITPGLPNAQFAMLFNYNDGTNAFGDGIFWSALSDYTDWTPSIATECGNIRITDVNGPFTAAIPYKDGVIAFKRHAMYAGTYVGGAAVWSWTRLSSGIGCIGKNALCLVNDVLCFADENGLWAYDGSYPTQMPGKVHQWWAAQIAAGAVFSGDSSNFVRLTWDKTNSQLWCAQGGSENAALPSTYIVFNPKSQLWTYYGTISSNVNGDVLELYAPDHASRSQNTATQFLIPDRTTIPAASFRLGAHGSTYGMVTFSSIRPQFTAGPSDTEAIWLSGTLYYGPSLRNITSASDVLTFTPPGKLEMVRSARFVSPQLNFTLGNTWECSKIAVDMSVNPKGE